MLLLVLLLVLLILPRLLALLVLLWLLWLLRRSLRPWGSMPVLRRRRRACGRVSPIAGCVTSAT